MNWLATSTLMPSASDDASAMITLFSRTFCIVDTLFSRTFCISNTLFSRTLLFAALSRVRPMGNNKPLRSTRQAITKVHKFVGHKFVNF